MIVVPLLFLTKLFQNKSSYQTLLRIIHLERKSFHKALLYLNDTIPLKVDLSCFGVYQNVIFISMRRQELIDICCR